MRVININTFQIIADCGKSADPADWLTLDGRDNADIDALSTKPRKYWKYDGAKFTEKDAGEKVAADAAEAVAAAAAQDLIRSDAKVEFAASVNYGKTAAAIAPGLSTPEERIRALENLKYGC